MDINEDKFEGAKRRVFQSRRGCVIISRFLLEALDEKSMKAIFSNFFPMAIETVHTPAMYAKLKFFGYSPLFRETDEGEVTPEYIMTIEENDGETILKSMIEVNEG